MSLDNACKFCKLQAWAPAVQRLARGPMPPPFAFVEDDPITGSPADGAGLLAGDAILRFGHATALDDLPGQLQPGVAVHVAVVEAATGKTASRIVVPRVYDEQAPHSLLGCQVSDHCPPRFLPHPAVEDEWEADALPPPPPPKPYEPAPPIQPLPPPEPVTLAAVPAETGGLGSGASCGSGRGRGRGRGRVYAPASAPPAPPRLDAFGDPIDDEFDFDHILARDKVKESPDEDSEQGDATRSVEGEEELRSDEGEEEFRSDEGEEEFSDEYDDDEQQPTKGRTAAAEPAARKAPPGAERPVRAAPPRTPRGAQRAAAVPHANEDADPPEPSEASGTLSDEGAGSVVSSATSGVSTRKRGNTVRRTWRREPSNEQGGHSLKVVACCRLMLLLSSIGSLIIVAVLASGPSILAADELAIGGLGRYSPDRPGEILPTFKQDVWRLASIRCDGPPSSVPPADRQSAPPADDDGLPGTARPPLASQSEDAYSDGRGAELNATEVRSGALPVERRRAADDAPWGGTASRAQSLNEVEATAAHTKTAALASPRQLDGEGRTDDSVLSVGKFAHAVVVAVSLQLVVCATGLGLAVLPSSVAPRLTWLLAAIYPPTAIALWLLLAAATMYFVVFRMEADVLVHRYWQCLDPSLSMEQLQELERERGEHTSRLYSDVTAAAVLCAAGDALAVLGLFAVCTLIGWRKVLRTGVKLLSGASASLGAALVALTTLLHVNGIGVPGDKLTGAIGAAVLLISVLGLCAARHEHLLLLQIYAAAQCLCAAFLLVVLAVVFIAGVEGLLGQADGWLSVIEDGGGGPEGDQESLTARELAELLQEHRLITSTASVLLVFLYLINVAMVMALRLVIGGAQYEYDSVGLADEEEGEEDAEPDFDGKSDPV